LPWRTTAHGPCPGGPRRLPCRTRIAPRGCSSSRLLHRPPALPPQISWALLRALVDPSIAPRISWKHEAHLKGAAKLVVGHLARVTDAAVELADGTTLPYDYLVLAPGAAGGVGKGTHGTLEERAAYYASEAARIAAAASVLIVGGGATGVEMAAEIASDHKGKTVTLVHSAEALVPLLTPKASQALRRELEAMGVRVLTGARVARQPDGGFAAVTDKGDDVAADVVLDCTGSAPATRWATAAGGHAAIKLDEHGFIVVTKELHVPDAANVFALGDAAATDDPKQAYLAVTNQVPTTVANILASLAAPPGALKPAPSGPHGMMLVTLGRANGLAQFPGGYVAAGWWLSWLPTMLKSKSLFIDKVRGEHGV
jgi:NADH dehydrogenase FAD-containing subunit